MSPSRFLDTNILLYSVSRHGGEAAKRAAAVSLLADEDWSLSVQVLQEFYVQATRVTGSAALPHDVAVDLVRGWQRFRVQPMTLAVFNDALAIKEAFRLSYWDSAIVAAARASLCDEVYSEDMQHGQRIVGVQIVNPFR
ncbi:MAG: PIN domain-containing protein [Acetobacteraceae bacterium]|nr:PIN domain-containing protein [Acetobacteraceae bacterium]